MAKVFLDTSVLPRNLNFTQAFRVLVDLVNLGKIEVVLSEIVVREWTSQRVGEFEKLLEDVLKNVKEVVNHPWAQELGDIAQMRAQAEEFQKASSKIAHKKCERFLEMLKAEILKFDPHTSVQVIDAYFKGGLPFATPKSRDDIPDAFIFQSLIQLASKYQVFFCAGDKQLRKAASTLKDVSAFKSIKELSSHLQPVLDDHQQFKKLLGLLKANPNELEKELARQAEDALNGLEITHHSIPEDNNTAMIEGSYGIEEVEFCWEDAEDFGGGWLSVPTRFKSEVDLQFYVYRMDAFSVPEWVKVSFGDFETDHYFSAGGDRCLIFECDLSVKFSEEEIEEQCWPEDFEIDNLELSEEQGEEIAEFGELF